MLVYCNKCRNNRDVKLRVENPGNHKINRLTLKAHADIKLEPVCTICGTIVEISSFALQHMVDKRDFLAEKKGKSSRPKCHACQSEQEVKLDHHDNPRCMRCGGIVKITPFMAKVMKEDLHLVMSTQELDKWNLRK